MKVSFIGDSIRIQYTPFVKSYWGMAMSSLSLRRTVALRNIRFVGFLIGKRICEEAVSFIGTMGFGMYAIFLVMDFSLRNPSTWRICSASRTSSSPDMKL